MRGTWGRREPVEQMQPPSWVNLIAVLSRNSDQERLFVYNIDPPPPDGESRVCRHWKSLQRDHLAGYDGPAYCLFGADRLLPGLPTGGTGFQALEPFFEGDPVALRETYRGLRHAVLGRARDGTGSSNADLGRTDALAAQMAILQAWLVGEHAEDPEDLVAIRPADLARFTESGDAIRIYRGAGHLAPGPAPLAGLSLSDLAQGAAPDVTSFGPVWCTFTALGPALPGPGVAALGPILFRAGRSDVLARTSWLLSRDLLQLSGLRELLGIGLEQIGELALRATAFYDLEDPRQWRQGRGDHLHSACKDQALRVLDRLREVADAAWTESERAMADYWRGLRAWYATSSDTAKADSFYLADHLARMAGALRTFLAGPAVARHAAERRTAETLLLIADLVRDATDPEPALQQLRRANPVQGPFSVPDYLAALADDTRPVEAPSPLLLARLADYAVHHRDVAQLGSAQERPGEAAINGLVQWLLQQQGDAQLPEHELRLVRELYRRDLAALDRLGSALGSAARIEFTVLNPWLDKGVEQEITIQVANGGTAAAEGFWLEILVRDGTGHEIAGPRRITASTLPPGPLRPHLTLPVRAEGPAAVLIIDYGHRDRRGEPGTWQEECWIEVREVSQRPRSILATLYEAGAPVFGPGRFFGRQTELNDIFSFLVGRFAQPILLRGPRRMGKTSLMKQIEFLLTHPEDLHDYGELQPDQIDRLRNIRPVYLSLQALSESGRIATDQFFAAVLYDAAAALGHPGADWPVNAPHPVVHTFGRTLGKLLDAEAATEGRRLLIMVDEWDETSRPEFRDLGIRLRSVMIDEQRVNWIIASTWIMRHEGPSGGSPLHSMCHVLEIKAPSWKDAAKVIETHARHADLHWNSDAMVAALEQTGQWPYLIQMLGAGAVKLINDDYSLRPVVELKTVQKVLGQIVSGKLQPAAAHFRSIFARDDQSGDDRDTVRPIGWLILWALNKVAPEPLSWQALHQLVEHQAPLAVSNRPDWGAWYDQELRDQIALLHEVQYIIEQDERKRYRFRVPVFRDWFNATELHLHEEMRERLAADLRRA